MSTAEHVGVAPALLPVGRRAAVLDPPLAVRIARGVVLALAAVLIPGVAARYDGSSGA